MLFIVLLLPLVVNSQAIEKNVLFLGNSYTSSHDMAAKVSSLAEGAGLVMNYDKYVPGGYTWRRVSRVIF